MQDNANKSSFFLNSKSEVQKFILSNTGIIIHDAI